MNNYGKLFVDELTEWLLEVGFIQSQCQISIFYKYAPDESNIVVLSYFDDCVYWYTSEAFGKWFVDTLGKIFHVNFLGYAHWFMSIIVSQMKDNSISVDKARYDTSVVEKYLDTATVKASTKFYKTILPYDMIFTKDDTSTSDEQVEKLTREFNIHYRACIGSLIYLLSTRLNFSFPVQKLAKFSANPDKVHFEVLVHLLRFIRGNKNLGLKYYAYIGDEQVQKLTRAFNIHYRACIGSFIYLLFKRVDLSFAVHKLAKFSANTGKVQFEGLVHLLRYITDNNNLDLNYYYDMKDAPLSDLLRKSINTRDTFQG